MPFDIHVELLWYFLVNPINEKVDWCVWDKVSIHMDHIVLSNHIVPWHVEVCLHERGQLIKHFVVFLSQDLGCHLQYVRINLLAFVSILFNLKLLHHEKWKEVQHLRVLDLLIHYLFLQLWSQRDLKIWVEMLSWVLLSLWPISRQKVLSQSERELIRKLLSIHNCVWVI